MGRGRTTSGCASYNCLLLYKYGAGPHPAAPRRGSGAAPQAAQDRPRLRPPPARHGHGPGPADPDPRHGPREMDSEGATTRTRSRCAPRTRPGRLSRATGRLASMLSARDHGPRVHVGGAAAGSSRGACAVALGVARRSSMTCRGCAAAAPASLAAHRRLLPPRGMCVPRRCSKRYLCSKAMLCHAPHDGR